MNFFKNTVAIVALFTIGSALGKATASRGGTAAQPRATAAQSKPMLQTKTTTQTYPQLVAFVKNQRNIWDAKSDMLNRAFIKTMMDNALAAGLDDIQLDALLQTARDYHAQFPKDREATIAILQNLEAQRADAVNAFNNRKAMSMQQVDLGEAL